MILKIIKAEYGGKDVKDIIESRIKNDSIKITVGNVLFGDPKPFTEKYLNVTYSINKCEYTNIFKEESVFAIDGKVDFIPISCMCISYGRVSTLEETLHSFLNQEYEGESELVIVQDYPLQKLHFSHPRVRIYNLDFTFETLGEKENFAISACKYQTISQFDDDDIALPNYLSSINKYFPGFELLHWSKAMCINDAKLSALGPVGNSGIVFNKHIWRKVGAHAFENAGFDATFVNKIKKANGRVTYIAPEDEDVCWGYYWANRSHHSSGMGRDDGTRPNVIIRHSEHIENLRKQGLIPTGAVELKPHWNQNYSQLLKDYNAR